MKECKKCHEVKPLDEFYKKSKARSHHGDGHDNTCKECIKAHEREPEYKQSAVKARARRVATTEGRSKEREKAKAYYHRHKDDPDFLERRKVAIVKWRNTPEGRATVRRKWNLFSKTESYKEAVRRYRTKYPEKKAARIAFSNAIATGKIHRPSVCSICDKQCIPHGHHPDYSKPLEVIWMCQQCHNDYHWDRQ